MASLRQIRRRMKSVHSINEITAAMEMIAAFRFKRAEGRFSRSRAYLTELGNILANLSSSAKDLSHPLFEKREIKKKTLVVMTGDRGLCGAYNANLLRMSQQWIRDNQNAYEVSVIPVGKIGSEFFRKKGQKMLSVYPERAMVDLSLAKKITEEIKTSFLDKKTDSVEILYAKYVAGGAGEGKVIPFLSLDYLLETKKNANDIVDYIYEPSFNNVFFSLLEKFLEGRMYLSLLESLTSEYSARMVAMKQATENGEEVLDTLKLLRNKTRQATITRELSEIVGGASVLA